MSFGDYFWYFVGVALSSPMNVLGAFLLAILCWILARAQFDKANPIDLSYLLVDATVGNVTLAKFGGLGAFLASTWVFIDLPVTGHFDATFAGWYMGVWGGVKVATDFMLKRDGDHRDG